MAAKRAGRADTRERTGHSQSADPRGGWGVGGVQTPTYRGCTRAPAVRAVRLRLGARAEGPWGNRCATGDRAGSGRAGYRAVMTI